jgi:hypothetical protein
MGLFLTESTFCFLLLLGVSVGASLAFSRDGYGLCGVGRGELRQLQIPYGMTNKGTRNDRHKGKGNSNGSGHDKSGSGIWGLEVGGVEEGEEDAAEGGFAAGGVVPLL